MSAPMSIRQFAKELGISEGAVRKAIKTERIPKEALSMVKVGTRTLPTITNRDLAARCYNKGTQHALGHQAGRNNPVSVETAKARFAREMYQAKFAQAQYEEKIGQLVPRSKVVLAIGAVSEAIKKIIPAKYHSVIDKALQSMKDDIDRQPESEA